MPESVLWYLNAIPIDFQGKRVYIPWQNAAINLKFWRYVKSAEEIKSWVQSGWSNEMYEDLKILS